MADPQGELARLSAQLSSLTERIYRIEQKLGIMAQSQPVAPPLPPAKTVSPPHTVPPSPQSPSAAKPSPPRLQAPAFTAPSRDSDALESQIGKIWLNRIGILAILIGVSYFIKYAFDNGWIGPSGKITLGILAGIGLVLWSESFRSKGYVVFSY